MTGLFANATTEELIEQALRAKPRSGGHEVWIVLLALAAVAALLFVGVLLLRKRSRSSGGIHSQGSGRRRRREHRPRNPTLAETGGLPPRRPLDQPPAGP
jgi:hypothetical protein